MNSTNTNSNGNIAVTNNSAQNAPNLVLPTDKTLQQATKLSLKTKKPICFYFYIDSLKNKIKIQSENNGEDRIIYKSDEEYTSPILNTYKSDHSYIVVTENTIYILSSDTPVA